MKIFIEIGNPFKSNRTSSSDDGSMWFVPFAFGVVMPICFYFSDVKVKEVGFPLLMSAIVDVIVIYYWIAMYRIKKKNSKLK